MFAYRMLIYLFAEYQSVNTLKYNLFGSVH
nr:MAG TPA: hypothetical protein [Crassvirales sp.]